VIVNPLFKVGLAIVHNGGNGYCKVVVVTSSTGRRDGYICLLWFSFALVVSKTIGRYCWSEWTRKFKSRIGYMHNSPSTRGSTRARRQDTLSATRPFCFSPTPIFIFCHSLWRWWISRCCNCSDVAVVAIDEPTTTAATTATAATKTSMYRAKRRFCAHLHDLNEICWLL
jgi:hypothetical protein